MLPNLSFSASSIRGALHELVGGAGAGTSMSSPPHSEHPSVGLIDPYAHDALHGQR